MSKKEEMEKVKSLMEELGVTIHDLAKEVQTPEPVVIVTDMTKRGCQEKWIPAGRGDWRCSKCGRYDRKCTDQEWPTGGLGRG